MSGEREGNREKGDERSEIQQGNINGNADVKRADDIQAQMRETFEAGRPSSNSHLVEILLGKWLITIKIQKVSLFPSNCPSFIPPFLSLSFFF